MIRFGLCCIFKEHPVKFRKTTAAYLSQFPEEEQKSRLARLCAGNAESLLKALEFCHENRIGGFRINSQILPLKTHPDTGYDIFDLPGAEDIIAAFRACGAFSLKHDIRTTFHPDQFIILSSPHPDVVQRSVADLVYQAQVAEWVNADVINIHAGGVYGDKQSAVSRLAAVVETLPDPIRKRLTLENDDRSYTPQDLFPVCRDLKIPLVYDVHHHRCLPDGLSVAAATEQSLETWNREPLFHISSPKDGWAAPDPKKHHDYIHP
ncbi:MAG: UV DNA damage repair endonuclease UvsE [Desulfotignum sp.]